jgi:hypothetical protein
MAYLQVQERLLEEKGRNAKEREYLRDRSKKMIIQGRGQKEQKVRVQNERPTRPAPPHPRHRSRS